MGLAVQSLRVADYLLGIVYAVSPATVRARRESAQVLHVAVRIQKRSIGARRIRQRAGYLAGVINSGSFAPIEAGERAQVLHHSVGVTKCVTKIQVARCYF